LFFARHVRGAPLCERFAKRHVPVRRSGRGERQLIYGAAWSVMLPAPAFALITTRGVGPGFPRTQPSASFVHPVAETAPTCVCTFARAPTAAGTLTVSAPAPVSRSSSTSRSTFAPRSIASGPAPPLARPFGAPKRPPAPAHT